MPDKDQLKSDAGDKPSWVLGAVSAAGFNPDVPFSWSMEVSSEIWNDPKNLMVTLSRFKQSVADVIGYQYEPRLQLRFFNPIESQLGEKTVYGRVVIDYVPKK